MEQSPIYEAVLVMPPFTSVWDPRACNFLHFGKQISSCTQLQNKQDCDLCCMSWVGELIYSCWSPCGLGSQQHWQHLRNAGFQPPDRLNQKVFLSKMILCFWETSSWYWCAWSTERILSRKAQERSIIFLVDTNLGLYRKRVWVCPPVLRVLCLAYLPMATTSPQSDERQLDKKQHPSGDRWWLFPPKCRESLSPGSNCWQVHDIELVVKLW